MLDKACLTAWNLPHDPFAYACEPLSPIDSLVDLDYYYDFYEWVDKAIVGTLAPTGRIASWQIAQPGRMMLLLISGAQGCGRSSLKNLLLYELADRLKPAPIVAEYTIAPSTDPSQSALDMARAVELQVMFRNLQFGGIIKGLNDTWRDDQKLSQPNLGNLFSQLKEAMKAGLPKTPVIVSINALRHQVSIDTAYVTATMVEKLADFVILSITDNDVALVIRKKCAKEGQPVALIDAPKVDLAKARTFVAERFSRARAGAAVQPPIFPFTDEALTILFAPTKRGGDIVHLPLRVAIEKLNGAMSARCNPAKPNPSPISAADMRASLGL